MAPNARNAESARAADKLSSRGILIGATAVGLGGLIVATDRRTWLITVALIAIMAVVRVRLLKRIVAKQISPILGVTLRTGWTALMLAIAVIAGAVSLS